MNQKIHKDQAAAAPHTLWECEYIHPLWKTGFIYAS